MPAIVIFYPDRCIPKMHETARLGFDQILLTAGTNKLSPEELQQLQIHPDYQRYSEVGALDIVGEQPATIDPLANTEIIDLLQYKDADAIKLVNNTADISTLESWLAVEQRTKIRTSLNTRITQLKTGEI